MITLFFRTEIVHDLKYENLKQKEAKKSRFGYRYLLGLLVLIISIWGRVRFQNYWTNSSHISRACGSKNQARKLSRKSTYLVGQAFLINEIANFSSTCYILLLKQRVIDIHNYYVGVFEFVIV